MFRFHDIWFLLGLLLVPLLIWVYRRLERTGRPRLKFPDLGLLKSLRPSPSLPLRHAVIGLRAVALALMIAALARPQSGTREEEVSSEGIDIMLALDISGSMRTPDFEPDNRLAVAKAVTKKFIQGRKSDRIGLVVFSALAFTQCPLTVDYNILLNLVDKVTFTRPEHDGTAIGNALATAVNRLRDSKAKSKVIILVTDGENNRGIDPLQGAGLAKAMGVKVYAVGVVSPGGVMQVVDDFFFGRRLVPTGGQVDESQMQEIAKETKGRYFRATDAKGLAEVFAEIDKLEKSKVDSTQYYRYSENFLPWLLGALLLLGAEVILAQTRFRRIP